MGGFFSSGGNLPQGTTESGVQPANGPPTYWPGMNVGSINGYTYDGPKLYFNEKAPNLKEYNLKEKVYVIKSPTSSNGSNGSNGSSGSSNSGSNSGILSDIENLPTIDYIFIAGALIIVVILI